MKKAAENSSSLRKLIHMSWRYRGLTLSILLISIALSIATAYRPKLIQQAIDEPISEKNFPFLLHLILWIGLLLFLEGLFQFVLNYFSNVLAQKVISELRVKLFNRLLSFKLDFFNKTPVGLLITRVVSDIETIAGVFSDGILLLFGDLFKILLIIGMMFNIDAQLAIISLLILPNMYWITRYFQRSLRNTFREERLQNAHLNSFSQERISGMMIVQLFNREKLEYKTFERINYQLMQAYFKTIFYFSIFFPIVELLSSVSVSALIGYGAFRAINTADVSSGEIVAFIFFIYMLFRPMNQMSDRFNTMQGGLAGADRIFDLLNQKFETPDEGKLQPIKLKGHILFENVHFSYTPEERVLKGLSLEILPGENVAIVGSTGAGKSTLVQLLARFYDIESGCISIDGHPIKDIALKNLRNHVRVMTQEPFLFNDTIRKNVSMGKSIDLKKIREKARIIGIDNIIMSLPLGYNQNVEERGRLFSIGQRQLLTFLRAQLHPHSILILDEATASTDSYTEDLMYKAMKNLTHKKTSIVIAHRLSTVKKMDKILVINKGILIEQGNHNDLLLKKGYYWKMYNSQISKKKRMN
ncbi:ABC transporter ATP-binding protein [Bacteroidetes bacterium endosymbiont of Geopemphigus sp.]|uniref:ABC transporter ATP-binding protein n=1 Tax=Bacteroidetes bacterium endosymbiont of Geopemphigus sp. TaxID=2047937 RepID=UPI000CD071F3|nr:ABC transporter ATP-binding protein [Bacteroidetes bacterium endosymbiont of Geopemphigus sp.]